MSRTHAAPVHEHPAGQCAWSHHHEDVDLECLDDAETDDGLCKGHHDDAVARLATEGTFPATTWTNNLKDTP